MVVVVIKFLKTLVKGAKRGNSEAPVTEADPPQQDRQSSTKSRKQGHADGGQSFQGKRKRGAERPQRRRRRQGGGTEKNARNDERTDARNDERTDARANMRINTRNDRQQTAAAEVDGNVAYIDPPYRQKQRTPRRHTNDENTAAGEVQASRRGRSRNSAHQRTRSAHSEQSTHSRSHSPRPSRSSRSPYQQRRKDNALTETETQAWQPELDLPFSVDAPSTAEQSEALSPAESILNTDVNFKELGINSPYLLSKLETQQIKYPTTVQAETLPIAMQGHNVVCASFTGSGKTLAFVLPILEKLINQELTQVVILSPTREIAMQTQKVIASFLPYKGITSGLVVGGLDMKEQRRILREYPSIFIATPGRMVHAIQEGRIWLKYTKLVVLDEMDRMLDMGFKEQLDAIYNEFPNNSAAPRRVHAARYAPAKVAAGAGARMSSRNNPAGAASSVATIAAPRGDGDTASNTSVQMLAFTATLLPNIQATIDSYMKTYQKVTIGDGINVNKNIEHKVFQLQAKDKFKALVQLVSMLKDRKTIVFFNTIEDTIKLSSKIRKISAHKILSLHSRKSQDERNTTLNDFRSDRAHLLFATDVAARGIDVYRIEYVINYGVPRNAEEYIHRLGRTGRMNLKGNALTLMEVKEKKHLSSIEKLLATRIPIHHINSTADSAEQSN